MEYLQFFAIAASITILEGLVFFAGFNLGSKSKEPQNQKIGL